MKLQILLFGWSLLEDFTRLEFQKFQSTDELHAELSQLYFPEQVIDFLSIFWAMPWVLLVVMVSGFVFLNFSQYFPLIERVFSHKQAH